MRKTNFGRRLCSLALIMASALAWTPTVSAAVRLPRILGSHMVLQQEKPLLIWGWSDANETITVALGSDTRAAKANERGEWKVTLPARKAGGPFTLKVSGSSSVVFEDVLIGEVWLASGQSNMEMGIGSCRDGKEEIAAASYPSIRLFKGASNWRTENWVNRVT